MDTVTIGLIFGIGGLVLAFFGVALGYYIARKDYEIIKGLKGKDLENYLKYTSENVPEKMKVLLATFGLIIAVLGILIASGTAQIVIPALGAILCFVSLVKHV